MYMYTQTVHVQSVISTNLLQQLMYICVYIYIYMYIYVKYIYIYVCIYVVGINLTS